MKLLKLWEAVGSCMKSVALIHATDLGCACACACVLGQIGYNVFLSFLGNKKAPATEEEKVGEPKAATA